MQFSDVLTTQFVMVYLFGLIIVVLYAREKFNVPTYDKELTGAFAQLPPQLLTLDSRYRAGLRSYLLAMLAIYTAVSFVGPSIIMYDPNVKKLIPEGLKDAKELWPVAAATFLMSAAAAKDTSVLGKIELTIRQYAHKKAYIPDAVYGLASSLRNLNIGHWLKDPSSDNKTLARRRAMLVDLVEEPCVKNIEDDPKQQGELATWVRTNILFNILDQIFNDRGDFVDAKLGRLAEVTDNKAAFDRLEKERKNLAVQYQQVQHAGTPASDELFVEIQRFLREASLSLAVLLSQAARNSRDLSQRLEQLGFESVWERDRSDYFFFHLGAAFAVSSAAFIGILILVVPNQILGTGSRANLQNWQVDETNGLIVVGIALMIYLVTFRTIDYQRDRLLDSLAWSEDLEGYGRTVVPATFVATAICMLVVSLALVFFDTLPPEIRSITGLVLTLVYQFLLVGLASGFFMLYMREAASLPKHRTGILVQIRSASPWLHAFIAAVLVAVFHLVADTYKRYDVAVKDHTAAKTEFEKLAPTMLDPDKKGIWFAGQYKRQQVDDIKKHMDLIGGAWGKAGGVESQIEWVKSICQKLHKSKDKRSPFRDPGKCVSTTSIEDSPASQESPPSDSPPRDPAADSTAPIQPTTAPTAENEHERNFDGLAVFLQSLLANLEKLRDYKLNHYPTYIFPVLVVFIMTYFFGLSCRFARAWLLYKNADDENGLIARFRDEMKKIHGEKVDVERCLTWRIPSLDHVTPLEALRYPDYRAKLFTKMHMKRIDWPKQQEGSSPPVDAEEKLRAA